MLRVFLLGALVLGLGAYAWAARFPIARIYIQSLAPGDHPFEVLAIEVGGNQTITEGSFATR